MAVSITIKELLEAGAHFGHKCSRWNPKMKRFIFEKRNDIYIIDLQQTLHQVKIACEFLKTCVVKGESILLVGTKKQAKEIVRESAVKCGLYWITERWLGGTLTNLETIRKSVARFNELSDMEEEDSMARYSKKEAASLKRELAKLKKNLEGIKNMDRLPGALFIIDPDREKIAVNEAKRLSIPIVALVDTNADPDMIDYPIACNDDAIKTINLIMSKVEQSVEEARGQLKDEVVESETAEAESAEEGSVEADTAVAQAQEKGE